jgi:DNA recombination protein RmuC
VKTRGVFGEVQLAALLEQVFTPEQYATKSRPCPAVGDASTSRSACPDGAKDGAPLWLPIDAKFPREDYERCSMRQERADPAAAEAAAQRSKRACARGQTHPRASTSPRRTPPTSPSCSCPRKASMPRRCAGRAWCEALQREHRIMLAGPTTLLATLTSLQMGFRTLALERRSAEVWQVLGAVKTEFQKFGDAAGQDQEEAAGSAEHDRQPSNARA